MSMAMKMLEDFRKFAYYREKFPGNNMPTISGRPMYVYIGDVIGLLKEENAQIERAVRDAIIDYQGMFTNAPNDETEREVVERAKTANKWLVDHGFEPKDLYWTKEEAPCL